MKAFINESIKEFIPETGYYSGIIEMGILEIVDLQELEGGSQKTEDGS